MKIDKPYVYENFTAVPFEKFISFNRINYPYFPEVIALIKPELNKRGISILQIRANQNAIENDVAVFDNLRFGQLAYLIKHSMLHFGEDDFVFDLCGYYDIPRVILFSNTYPNNSKPYWGSQEKQRVLSTTGPWGKPSLNSEASQNFVRFISPEKIAAAIMGLLHIDWSPQYETVYPGALYRPFHDVVELVAHKNAKINVNGPVTSISVRMDYLFDEQFLASVLQKSRCSIITDKPININLLNAFRSNIQEIHYVVDESSSLEFAQELARINIQHSVASYNNSTKLKEKFFETCVIHQIPTPKLIEKKELKNGLAGLMYKSTKRVFSKDAEFKSRCDELNDKSSLATEFSPCPEVENVNFMRELEFFFIVKPLTET